LIGDGCAMLFRPRAVWRLRVGSVPATARFAIDTIARRHAGGSADDPVVVASACHEQTTGASAAGREFAPCG